MKCYDVVCVDANKTEHHVGVMTSSKVRAMLDAEKTLLEGKHIHAIAVYAVETDGI